MKTSLIHVFVMATMGATGSLCAGIRPTEAAPAAPLARDNTPPVFLAGGWLMAADKKDEAWETLEPVPPPARPVKGGPQKGGMRLGGAWPASKATTLVVAPGLDAKQLGEVEEDLLVMSRLLNKEIQKEALGGAPQAMGIVIASFGPAPKPDALYLEGYGALFFLEVPFPLQSAPESKLEKKTDEAGASEWEKTRREVLGGGEGMAEVTTRILVDGQPLKMPPYDAEKVERLKQALFSALRHASHIRLLKPEENITLAVTTVPSPALTGAYGANVSFAVTGAVTGGAPGPVARAESGGKRSVMILRVKKADVDAFDQGKLTVEEFKKKAALRIY